MSLKFSHIHHHRLWVAAELSVFPYEDVNFIRANWDCFLDSPPGPGSCLIQPVVFLLQIPSDLRAHYSRMSRVPPRFWLLFSLPPPPLPIPTPASRGWRKLYCWGNSVCPLCYILRALNSLAESMSNLGHVNFIPRPATNSQGGRL